MFCPNQSEAIGETAPVMLFLLNTELVSGINFQKQLTTFMTIKETVSLSFPVFIILLYYPYLLLFVPVLCLSISFSFSLSSLHFCTQLFLTSSPSLLHSGENSSCCNFFFFSFHPFSLHPPLIISLCLSLSHSSSLAHSPEDNAGWRKIKGSEEREFSHNNFVLAL